MTRPLATVHTTAADIVTGFLRALERCDIDDALAMVTEDLVYQNVSLPTVRGRRGLDRAFRPMLRPGRMGFAVCVHHVASDGDVVLTDRTDEIIQQLKPVVPVAVVQQVTDFGKNTVSTEFGAGLFE